MPAVRRSKTLATTVTFESRAAAVWALVVLVGFIAEIVRMRLRGGPGIPCGCFGGRQEVLASLVLVRNAALAWRSPPSP